MEDVYLYPNNVEKMIIEANGKSCEVVPHLSAFDLTFAKRLAKCPDKISFAEMVAIIISKHTKGVFEKEEILELDNSTIQKYIELCIKSDEILEESFNSIKCDDLSEKFIRAISKTFEYYAKKLKTQNSTFLNTQIAKISNAITSSLTPKVISVANSYSSEILHSISETLINNIKPLFDTVRISFDYSSIFNNISKTLFDLAKSFKIATLSENEKEQLIEAYKKWGETGWTLPPQADISLFSTPPQDINVANELFKSYTTKKDMSDLFAMILDLKHINKSDIIEAIECFNKRHYKACAMILFSLIDGRLIRLQGRAKAGEMRAVGKGAVKRNFGELESQTMNLDDFYNYLNRVNLIGALSKVFEFGDNFKVQPEVINRNFIDHGMMHKKVTRRDCCLLFLLLYNFTLYVNS